MILAFDLETTGLPSKQSPLTSPSQPHIVSCSALQYDPAQERIQQSMSKVVTPNGWEWDDTEVSEDRAFAVHGLTNEYCTKRGREEKMVLDELLDLWDDEAQLVSHNLTFDAAVIAIAIARYYPNARALQQAWNAAALAGTCTMRASKSIVKAQTKPNAAGKTRLKAPNLAETYEFFLDEPLERHHSANADAVACLLIWNEIQNHV